MTFTELVSYFRKGGSFEEFCQSQSLNAGSEVIEIYMEQPINMGSEMAFFEIEKTEGKIEYSFNGVKYFNLFDFYYFLDAIEESNNDKNAALTDIIIAKRLYDYAVNDA